MKRYFIIALLFAVFASSCKQEDDVDPNITKDFVGTWAGALMVENGYQNRTDWKITRETDDLIKITSTFNFIATSTAYTSYTENTVLENVTVADGKTIRASTKVPVSGDVILVDFVGIIEGDLLTVTSTGKYQKTGVAIPTFVEKFTKN